MTSEYRNLPAELPAHIMELVDAFRNPITQIEFLNLFAIAILEPVLVDAETADRMVRPYSWFLAAVSNKSFSPRRGVLSSDGTGTCSWE